MPPIATASSGQDCDPAALAPSPTRNLRALDDDDDDDREHAAFTEFVQHDGASNSRTERSSSWSGLRGSWLAPTVPTALRQYAAAMAVRVSFGELARRKGYRADAHQLRQVAGDTGLVQGIEVLARAHQNLIWVALGRCSACGLCCGTVSLPPCSRSETSLVLMLSNCWPRRRILHGCPKSDCPYGKTEALPRTGTTSTAQSRSNCGCCLVRDSARAAPLSDLVHLRVRVQGTPPRTITDWVFWCVGVQPGRSWMR